MRKHVTDAGVTAAVLGAAGITAIRAARTAAGADVGAGTTKILVAAGVATRIRAIQAHATIIAVAKLPVTVAAEVVEIAAAAADT